jgi:hypothetical protein
MKLIRQILFFLNRSKDLVLQSSRSKGAYLKLLSLTAVLLFAATPLSAQTVFLETFDGTTTPTGWTNTAAAGPGWLFSTGAGYDVSSTLDHTGNGGNYAWVDFSGTDDSVVLETPVINVSTLTAPLLRFYLESHYTGTLSPFNFMYVEAFDGTTWVNVTTLQGNTPFGWDEYTFNLTPYIYGGTNVRIRFRGESGGSSSDFYNDLLLDDVEVLETPSCPAPSTLAAANVTATTADLSWVETGSSTNWQIEYGPSGFAQGSGTTAFAGTNPFNVTGLASATDFDFYVRAICGPGDTSSWSGPAGFTTACAIFTAPFLESFDGTSTPNCWTESGSEAWRYSTTAGYAAASAGDQTGNGGNYAWIDGSTPSGATQISTLESPFVDLSPLTTPALSYWIFSNNTTNPGDNNTLIIDFYDGAAWLNIDTVKQDFGQNWTNFLIDLSLYTITGPVQVRFTIIEDAGTAFYNDILIDDVEFLNGPSCFPVTGLDVTASTSSSLTASWMSSSSNWEVQMVPSGSSPAATGTATSMMSYTQTGLMAATMYDVYVRAVCGPGDTSSWVMISAMTDCPAVVPGDDAASAIDITGLNFSTIGNTASGCYTSTTGNTSEDVWYRLVTADPCVGSFDASLCGGTSYDSYIRIYDANLNQIAFNDDNCGLQSEILGTAINQGVVDTFYIVVEGFGSSTGNYTLDVTQYVDTIAADFSYPTTDYCLNDGVISATINQTTGGTFSEATGNLDLNTLTGEFLPDSSLIGAYDVVYTAALNPACTDSDTFSLTVNNTDTAMISFANTAYCYGEGTQLPTNMGTVGGTYSTASLSLNVDPATGAIDVDAASEGIHAIFYTTPNACFDVDTFVVNIGAADTADISYMQTAYCATDANPVAMINADNNGLFSSTTGLMIDPITGEIMLGSSTVGNYDVTYTTQGQCPATDVFNITINAAEDASFAYDSTTFCLNSTGPAAIISGNAGGTFSATGIAVDPATGAIDLANASIGAGYNITYTTAGPCPESSTVSVNVIDCNTVISSNTAVELSENAVKLYPNPNQGQFNIEWFGTDSDAIIHVYNAVGKQVMTRNLFMQKDAVYNMNLTNFAAGSYLVQIQTAESMTTIKMIVTRP